MTGDLLDRLAGKKVVVVAGSGGVGKTTTAAAVGLGLAATGLRVAVITIDPALRLADALGLDELSNDPRQVQPARFAEHGVEMKGELWAMMLDPKRTFDELIERLAPDEQRRDEILGNRIYQELSGAVAGSQEFTAIAKLYDLDREGGFDVLLLDTPPARNALDFLDAPDRLTQFFEGRALKLLLAPTGLAARIVGRGTGVIFSVLQRITGVDLLRDLSTFFAALSSVIDGFTERAAGVKALLADETTTFLIVSSPQREPSAEAVHFADKLREGQLPFGGLIVNRVDAAVGSPAPSAGDLLGELGQLLGDEATAKKVVRALADADAVTERDRAAIDALRERLGEEDPILVPTLDSDVHDIEGLALVCRHLFARGDERTRLLAVESGLT